MSSSSTTQAEDSTLITQCPKQVTISKEYYIGSYKNPRRPKHTFEGPLLEGPLTNCGLIEILNQLGYGSIPVRIIQSKKAKEKGYKKNPFWNSFLYTSDEHGDLRLIRINDIYLISPVEVIDPKEAEKLNYICISSDNDKYYIFDIRAMKQIKGTIPEELSGAFSQKFFGKYHDYYVIYNDNEYWDDPMIVVAFMKIIVNKDHILGKSVVSVSLDDLLRYRHFCRSSVYYDMSFHERCKLLKEKEVAKAYFFIDVSEPNE